MTESPAKPRRRFRFGLRSLMLLVLVLSAPLGWIARELNEGRRQAAALAELRKLNVQVTDRFLDETPSNWLRNRIGGRDWIPVLLLSANSTPFGDEHLQYLAALPELTSLHLNSTQVSDAGLPHLLKMTQLKSLDLRDAKVTKAGLLRLQQALPDCAILWVGNMPTEMPIEERGRAAP